ncbi:MAG: hypothetical protein ACYDAC_12510 [Candidatus Dormibacteria bacterium]
MRCSHCGMEVPEGRHCARCGALQERPGDRLHSFALHPGEHVLSPNLASTLLPHLAAQHLHLARWLLLGGGALVTVLAATGLVGEATVIAAILVPVLYLAYLRRVDSFSGDPLAVLAGTVLAGGILGVGATLGASALGNRLGGGGVLVLDSLVAAVMVGVTPLLPLALLRRRHPETLDGLVLGVAAGAGFAMAETLVNLAGAVSGSGLRASPANWVFTLLSAALLVPLLAGGGAGLVAASLWRRPGGHAAALRAAGLPLAVVAAVAFLCGSEVLDEAALSPAFVVLWQAAVVGGVVVAARILLHATLLDEVADRGFREEVCAHCGRRGFVGGFCPHCGAAQRRSAATRRGRPAPLVA